MQRVASWILCAAVASAAAAQSSVTQIDAIVCERAHARVTSDHAATATTTPTLFWRGDVVQRAQWNVTLGTRRVANRLIIVRMPIDRVRFSLEIAREGATLLPWSLAAAPADAAVAVNAGQFTDDGPWGWVVHRQREQQAPGAGPLAGAFIVDSAGNAQILTSTEIAAWRTPLRAVEAVQSYPMLLVGDGRVPNELCRDASGIDREHRDARLAIGITRDAHVLLVLSRFQAPGGSITSVPIGPTTPEMAEILRRLGADRAMMLDGGLSAQMLVRTSRDTVRYEGWRNVPLALVARLRDSHR